MGEGIMEAGIGSGPGCELCRGEPGFTLPFSMAFQPIVRLADGVIVAHEALVRGPGGELAHTILGAVSPGLRHAFDQATRVGAITLAARLGLDAGLDVNFSPNAVRGPAACLGSTLEAAARAGIAPERLSFEIVEDERMFDLAFMRRLVAEYRRHGIRLALDNFGAGYAGLGTLFDLGPDVVKLDMKLIRGIARDPVRRGRVIDIIDACRSAGFEIIAEGIEAADEIRVLAEAGVELFQGYFLAKPAFERLVTREELPDLVALAGLAMLPHPASAAA